MPKYLVLVPVGMLIDASSPDIAAGLAPSNITFASIAQASLPVKGIPVVRSLDAAQTPSPVSMSDALKTGGGVTAASLQGYVQRLTFR